MMDMIRVDYCPEDQRRPGTYWIRRLGESNVRIGQWLGAYWIVDGEGRLTDDAIAAVSIEDIHCEVA